jgi:hypothetical protein
LVPQAITALRAPLPAPALVAKHPRVGKPRPDRTPPSDGLSRAPAGVERRRLLGVELRWLDQLRHRTLSGVKQAAGIGYPELGPRKDLVGTAREQSAIN